MAPLAAEGTATVAVVGAGAVGSFFGAVLARGGHRVTLIGRAPHVAAVTGDGLQLEMGGRVETVRVAASTSLAAAHGADLVLVCVKSTDTDQVARELAPHLDGGAVVISLQNGVENAATIARHVRGTVIPAVVYVATAMPVPGRVLHLGRGDLVIGPLDAETARDPGLGPTLQRVARVFGEAQVPVRITGDVITELWSKLLINCAYNAISALAQAPYGTLGAMPAVRQVQHTVVREVVAVAAADGVELPLDASMEAMELIAVSMRGQLSSTAQDLARRKPSEIDHLNGFVSRRGRELGVPTPANDTLTALVKLVERMYEGGT